MIRHATKKTVAATEMFATTIRDKLQKQLEKDKNKKNGKNGSGNDSANKSSHSKTRHLSGSKLADALQNQADVIGLQNKDLDVIVEAMTEANVNFDEEKIDENLVVKLLVNCGFRLDKEIIDQKMVEMEIKVHEEEVEVAGHASDGSEGSSDQSEEELFTKTTTRKAITVRSFTKLYMNFKNTSFNHNMNDDQNNLNCEVQEFQQFSNTKIAIKSRIAKVMATNNHTTEHNVDERKAFATWINNRLKDDEILKENGYLPIDPNLDFDLFEKCSDGVIFIRLLQLIRSNNSGVLIDIDTVNIFNKAKKEGQRRLVQENLNSPDLLSFENVKIISKKIENLNLAIYSAASIGCRTINFDSSEIIFNHNPGQILEFLWELIKTKLFLKIGLEKTADTYETLTKIFKKLTNNIHQDSLYCLGPEDILLKWVNHHLQANKDYEGEPIENFGSDIKDSIAYQYLLEQLQEEDFDSYGADSLKSKKIMYPNHKKSQNLSSRALYTLKMADNLQGNCKEFLTYKEIVSGNEKLNMAFIANLFNWKLHHLQKLQNNYATENKEDFSDITEKDLIEGKSERIAKNWINSLDLRSTCNYIYTDLRDGIIILKIFDRIKPGCVDWSKVIFPPYKKLIDASMNCCYAIELLQQHGLGVKINDTIRGHDIHTANPRSFTLGIVIQLMRTYKMSQLYKFDDDENGDWEDDGKILNWINDKIEEEELKIKSFKDKELKSGHAMALCLDTGGFSISKNFFENFFSIFFDEKITLPPQSPNSAAPNVNPALSPPKQPPKKSS